jgi:esterase/lipase superfamily enzyme
MSIKIYFEIPSANRGQTFDILIDGSPATGLTSLLFRNKRMLNYSLKKYSDGKITLFFHMKNGPTTIKVHFVNEENNKTFTEIVRTHEDMSGSPLTISLLKLMDADSRLHRSTKSSGSYKPIIGRTIGKENEKKRFRTRLSFDIADPTSYNFEHYKNQVPPEQLLSTLAKEEENAIIDVFYATDRKQKKTEKGVISYENKRGTIEFGSCKVNVPKKRKKGELPIPHWYSFEFTPSKDDHMILNEVKLLEPKDFFGEIRDKVAASPQKDAFIFIHGFNVSFRESVLRTAQMAKDLNFNGAPIVYSWPSKRKLLGYSADEATATGFSLDNIVHLLKDIKATSGAQRIHLIAHSMGNRHLTEALKTLFAEGFHETFQFNQVILAAPDMDAQVFVKEVAPKISQVSERVTLYASKYDFPLFFSGKLHGIQRTGQSSGRIAIAEGVDTIDASNETTDLLGHGYFAESKLLIDDIFHTTRHNHSPEERNLKMRAVNKKVYWEFD